MVSARLLKNGAIGLVVMIVVGLVPMLNVIAPIVGGAVAGYLQKEDLRGGAVAGAVTGLLWTLLTLLLLVVVVAGAGLTAPPGVGPFDWLPAAGGAAWIALLFVVMNGVVVVTATLGGFLGGVIARDAAEESAPPRQPDV